MTAFLEHAGRRPRRRARARQIAAALDQRRPDGDLLLSGRAWRSSASCCTASCRPSARRRCPAWRPSAAWRCRPSSISPSTPAIPSRSGAGPSPPPPTSPLPSACWPCSGPGSRRRSRSSCWRSPSSTTWAPSSSSRCSIPTICHWLSLALALAGRRRAGGAQPARRQRLAPYLLTGLFIWVCVLKSGVHATLAGVVVALAIPLTRMAEGEPSPLEQLEQNLHPWVAFGVLPLFAFANAGVSLPGLSLAKLLEPVPLGIARACFLASCSAFSARPSSRLWAGCAAARGRHLGAALRRCPARRHRLHHEPVHRHAGFRRSRPSRQLRLGVLTGSLLSAIAGYLVLGIVRAPARTS